MKRDRQHHCSAGKARNLNALSTIRRCWNVWNPYPVRIFKRSSLNVRSAEPHSIAANRCTQPGAPLRGRTRLLCMQFRLDGRRLYEKTMEPYGSSNSVRDRGCPWYIRVRRCTSGGLRLSLRLDVDTTRGTASWASRIAPTSRFRREPRLHPIPPALFVLQQKPNLFELRRGY